MAVNGVDGENKPVNNDNEESQIESNLNHSNLLLTIK